MLVLTRRIGERLILTLEGRAPIVIELLAIHGKQARLGITAETSVVIEREEIAH